MTLKKILIFVFTITLTVAIVISAVVAARVKQASENPVSVFFGDDIVIENIEIEGVEQAKIIEVDLVRDQKSYVKKDNIVSIAVLGRDATPVEEQRRDGGNTDIMIVMAIDLDDASIQAISIPRDTVAHLYHYNRRQELDDEFFDKINSAYSAGGAENEAEFQLANSVVCIQEFMNTFGVFDMEINNYVEIGLTGLRELTDKIGGIDVVLNNGIPGVGGKGQTVHLTGKTAMTYVRDRHNSGGDLGRVSNTQVFVKALAKKLQSEGLAESVPKLAGSMISGNLMRTDLNLEEISALAGLLSDIDIDSLSMQTVDSLEVDDIGKIKEHMEEYTAYDYEAFYGAKKWRNLEIKDGDYYDSGVFADYFSLEEIIISMYYDEVVQ